MRFGSRNCCFAVFSAAAFLFLLVSNAYAVPDQAAKTIDIAHTEIEDLLGMTITSSSRIPEELREVSAAVFVLTGDDIRRSGARNIPEALRLVPGVNVAKIDGNKWAVSIRGFNSRTANKLLVLIDGRSIYNPLFSGVLWETKGMLMEDIDRIEVIRGPGGSIWGANAVNGVINIITKHSNATQGARVIGGGGTEEKGFGTARYGGKFSERTSYRVYGRYINRDNGFLESGSDDDSFRGEGGFRIDGKLSETGNYMLQADYQEGEFNGTTATGDVENSDAYVLGRWQEALGDKGEISAHSYYEHSSIGTQILDEDREIFEADIQENYRFNNYFELVGGQSYRFTTDNTRGTPMFRVTPEDRDDHIASAFIEGHLHLLENKVRLRLGSKFEVNTYTDFEIAPAVGVSWTISEKNVLWGSISRAVRTPSRLEDDVRLSLANGFVLKGDRNLESENLVAYELGHRFVPSPTVFLDVTAFYNVYDDLVTSEGATLGNKANADSYGAEAAVTWAPVSWAWFQSAYSYLDIYAELDGDSIANPSSLDVMEGNNPHHQASLASHFNIGTSWECDFDLRFVDSLASPGVDPYLVGDARLAWRIVPNIELAVVGQNLFERRHFEQAGVVSSQVEQGVYGQITWEF